MSILLGYYSNKERGANEKHLTLCKASERTLVVDYLDSTKI